MKKGRIIKGDAFCHCGSKLFLDGRNLEGKKIYGCGLNKHIIKEDDIK